MTEAPAPSFEELAKEFGDPTLTSIDVDGLAILKLVKHCKDCLPDIATGQIVGLDNGTILEVTNCFPLPQEDEETVEGDFAFDMLRCFREANLDSNIVGWYTTAYADNVFMDSGVIKLQCDNQAKSPKSVMLVFDPLKTTQDSTIALRAFRLTQPFMSAYTSQSFTVESLRDSGVSFRDIFEELPIRIRNGAPMSAFLQHVAPSGRASSLEPERDRLDLAVYPYLEKNMEYLIDCLDDLEKEQAKFQLYQRHLARFQAHQKRKLEDGEADGDYKPPQEPRQLETWLLSSQIASFCDQIGRVAGQSTSKLFLLGGLQKDT